MLSLKIVVARYNENIDWLKPLSQICVICNKGEPLHCANEILYENVGRESDTYLRWIIDNYDKLPDVVVFTQANIADHARANDPNILVSLAYNATKNGGKSMNFITHKDQGKCYCFDHDWNVLENGQYFLHDNYKNDERMSFRDWFCEHIRKPYPNPIKIYCNAIFSVNKKRILRHSVDYYKKLLVEVNHHVNPAEGHFMERSWYYIFCDEN